MTTLLVDVGATSIKWTFGADGELERQRRRPTPQPCRPERLVAMISERALARACSAIAVGFPGTVNNGVVIDGANLVRIDGPFSPRDESLDREWRGFDLAAALCETTNLPTVVVNDAHAAACGCDVATGRSLVITLGTGCGVGFLINHDLVDIRDFGDDLIGDCTLDQLAGEAARRRDHEAWLAQCNEVVAYLVAQTTPDQIYVAGGNAGRLRPSDITSTVPVELVRGEPAFRGLVRLAPHAIC